MKHAVLGAGGVGGLLAGVLSNEGDEVALLVRSESLATHPQQLRVQRPSETFEAPVRIRARLTEPVDVLWIAVKAYQLVAALHAVPDSAASAIVPLLNGVDHVPVLRSHFTRGLVVPGTIAVESERIAPGHIIQRSPFVRVALSAIGESQLRDVAARLTHAGFSCEFQRDEATMLWSKLAFLAPFALATTAGDKNKEQIFADSEWRTRLESAVREACAVAAAEGAALDPSKIIATLAALPAQMRSSMQKDVAAGRAPELDAIGGPITRAALRRGISVPATLELVAKIQARLNAR